MAPAIADEEFVNVIEDDEPLLGIGAPNEDLSQHKQLPCKFACQPCATCCGRHFMPQTAYAMSRINLLISLFWDVAFISILAYITDRYLDPDEYEGRLFIVVSFTCKCSQVLAAICALCSKEKHWYGYLPYLLCQGISCLMLLVALAFIFLSWQDIETLAKELLTDQDIHEIRVEMSWTMVAIAWWKLANWYALLVVHEYVAFIRKHRVRPQRATSEEEEAALRENMEAERD